MQVCRALLSLAQKNISFGKLLTNEHRAKTLVLTNVSDAPLLYKLKKTGTSYFSCLSEVLVPLLE